MTSFTPTYTCPMGSCTFSSSGLPSGVSINSSSGLVSGTAPTTGTYTATLTIADPSGNSATTASFTLNVAYPTLALTIPTTIYSLVSTTPTFGMSSFASGGSGNYSFSKTSGPFPGSVAMNSSGVLSGTVSSTAQTYSNITIKVTDTTTGLTVTDTFTWVVWKGQIENNSTDTCLRYNNNALSVVTCGRSNTTWVLEPTGLLHLSGSTALCLQAGSTNGAAASMASCDASNPLQQWTYNSSNSTFTNTSNSYVLALNTSSAVQVQTYSGTNARQKWTLN